MLGVSRPWRFAVVALGAVAMSLPGPLRAGADAAEPGRITTVVRDAGTGAPVAGVTVHAIAAGDRFADLWSARAASEADGTVLFEGLTPGRYSFFIQPGDAAYGMQWLGVRGGAGDRDTALEVTAPEEGVLALPDVRLDPAGTVTGSLTEAATGAPVTAQVSVASVDPLWRETTPSVFGSGSFTFSGLGPYGWKLFVMPDGTAGPASRVAAQWSGGVPDRRRADRIPVVAGQTTVADQRLRAGTVVSGTAGAGPVYAFHAGTREILAVSDQPDTGRYAVRLLPGQRAELSVGTSPQNAVAVRVGWRPLVVDLAEQISTR